MAGDSDATNDRAMVGTRKVDIVVSCLLFGLACVLGWDSWRVGMTWADDGPRAGYFPFYLSLLLAGASTYGLVTTLLARDTGSTFVTRDQLNRVMQVFVPTLLYVVLTQFLGLYVASFLLIAGFMWWVGKFALWKSILTGLLFTVAMFATFEIAFNVIMPKGPLEDLLGY
jgi:putative tricarboxylic transport membrane protein